MPWKESHLMDERTRFIGRMLEGERMADVCREFGISRKTGYKHYGRYLKEGLVGLMDQSRAPERHPNQTAEEVERMIVELRKSKTSWGPKKLRKRLECLHPGVRSPVLSDPCSSGTMRPKAAARSRQATVSAIEPCTIAKRARRPPLSHRLDPRRNFD